MLRLRGWSEVRHPAFGQEQQAVEHFEDEGARLMYSDHDGLIVPNRQIPAYFSWEDNARMWISDAELSIVDSGLKLVVAGLAIRHSDGRIIHHFLDEKFLCVPRVSVMFESLRCITWHGPPPISITRIATITPQLIIKIPRSEWIVPQSNIPTNTFRLNSFTKFYLSVPGLEAQHKNF